jgi:hypothetical protein
LDRRRTLPTITKPLDLLRLVGKLPIRAMMMMTVAAASAAALFAETAALFSDSQFIKCVFPSCSHRSMSATEIRSALHACFLEFSHVQILDSLNYQTCSFAMML